MYHNGIFFNIPEESIYTINFAMWIVFNIKNHFTNSKRNTRETTVAKILLRISCSQVMNTFQFSRLEFASNDFYIHLQNHILSSSLKVIALSVLSGLWRNLDYFRCFQSIFSFRDVENTLGKYLNKNWYTIIDA